MLDRARLVHRGVAPWRRPRSEDEVQSRAAASQPAATGLNAAAVGESPRPQVEVKCGARPKMLRGGGDSRLLLQRRRLASPPHPSTDQTLERKAAARLEVLPVGWVKRSEDPTRDCFRARWVFAFARPNPL